MRSPNCDSVWPIQKVRNRPSRQSDGLGSVGAVARHRRSFSGIA